jgi:anti-sigma regulatory factor (Ser/Thr protein kinase)
MNGRTSAYAPDAPMGGAHAAGGGSGAWQQNAARLPAHRNSWVPVPPSHHGHHLARWPLRSALMLGALEAAVPSARAHVRQLLREWHRADLSQDASVVLSELVTNAVMASAELRPTVAPVLMWLGSDVNCALVGVADAVPRPPVRLNLSPDDEGGRGLALVEAFSGRWGWHPITLAGLVKVVWAEWRLPSPITNPPATTGPARGHAE